MEVSGESVDKYLSLGLALMFKQAGYTPEQISAALGIGLEEVLQQLASDSCHELEVLAYAFNKQFPLRDAKLDPVVSDKSDDDNPTNIYSFEYERSVLHWTNLRSGEQFSHTIPSYIFKEGSILSELSDGSLLLTGGGHPPSCEVVRIDPRSDFRVSLKPPMVRPRSRHSSRLHAGYLYVIGGYYIDRALSACERFVCAENIWQVLPPLPGATSSAAVVVVEESLYVLGGSSDTTLDLIQRLCLESLTWDVIPVRLPCAGSCFPCFTVQSQVYFILKDILFVFMPQTYQIRQVKQLPPVWAVGDTF